MIHWLLVEVNKVVICCSRREVEEFHSVGKSVC